MRSASFWSPGPIPHFVRGSMISPARWRKSRLRDYTSVHRFCAKQWRNDRMAAVETEGAKSEDEFDTWRWHDNLIYGLKVDIGDTESQDWRSDLIFDIDFIVE